MTTPVTSLLNSATATGGTEAAVQAAQHHELPLHAVQITEVLGLPITNSMIETGIAGLLLVAVAILATRRMKTVPGPLQNFVEWLVESLLGFLESLLGPALTRRTFWFFATVFLVILATNWLGLVPGVGTIGWGLPAKHGIHVEIPILRGGNADLNTTLAMAMVFFGLWLLWGLQTQGPVGMLKHLFGSKGDVRGFFGLLLALVFVAAGLLEVISILFRPVSLSLRLFGNIYAGETMLETMQHMVPALSWLLPIPFYLMEVLVGLVQATVFMLLTAVFTMLICSHDEADAHTAAPTSH